jgi:hypothetical protein
LLADEAFVSDDNALSDPGVGAQVERPMRSLAGARSPTGVVAMTAPRRRPLDDAGAENG